MSTPGPNAAFRTAAQCPLPKHSSSRYVTILGRRRVRSWRGLMCFSGRVLARAGYLERSAGDIVSACATLVRWWDAEGRPSTLCLRPSNAFTAHLPLLYTSLSPHDPIHDAACRQLHQVPDGAYEDRPTTTVPAALPVNDWAPITTDDAWRAFTRRFPVLGVYQPIWIGNHDSVRSILSGPPSDAALQRWDGMWQNPEGALSFVDISHGMAWPTDALQGLGGEMTVAMLARKLQPSEPWERWVLPNNGGYRRPAVWHLRRALAILIGFGDIGGSVLEAIRLPARLRGDEEGSDDMGHASSASPSWQHPPDKPHGRE